MQMMKKSQILFQIVVPQEVEIQVCLRDLRDLIKSVEFQSGYSIQTTIFTIIIILFKIGALESYSKGIIQYQ